jgi:hypothetical protein
MKTTSSSPLSTLSMNRGRIPALFALVGGVLCAGALRSRSAEPSPATGTVVEEVRPLRALVESAAGATQPVRVRFKHTGAPVDVTVSLEGGPSVTERLKDGVQTVELRVPAVTAEARRTVVLQVSAKPRETREVTLKPVRHMTVYVLPHSHTDIGYTEIQTAIERKQVNNLLEGMAAARKTADYPPGARFVWNVEVLWAADLYLRRLSEPQKADFFEAVKKGQVVLNGMYLNELTGLCRPEELVRLFRFATEFSERTGVPITSAMISDVPGYTWGSVTAMAQSGIRYFSTAPNYFDRIGTILREWENKPFWWEGPDGRSRVLVWIPFWGYAMSHEYHDMSEQLVDDFTDGLEKRGYPYEIAYVRWSGHGDNAVPDPAICEFIRDWNARYTWPRFQISGTPEAFSALEKRYGRQLPVARGDWTPYWEDGAGSSAVETAMNRETSDRLSQAEALFAMQHRHGFPAAAFGDAWRHVLLYSEHTWGADVSVSDPECQKTREQWEIKQGYARAADTESRALLVRSLEGAAGGAATAGAIDVYNTLGWSRTELVTVEPALSAGRDRVTDDTGKGVPSQRLSTGALVFLARNLPPFAARRFVLSEGKPDPAGLLRISDASLDNGLVQVRIDPVTGAICDLKARGLDGNLVDATGGEGLNDYRFLAGDDLKQLARNGPVRIRVGERGPLVASIVVESAAPGCRSLVREIRLTAGMDYVEVENRLDKERAAIPPTPGDWKFAQKGGKESVNFAFPFNIPEGEVQLDLPLGWMRPEKDQIPSACKNWFTVGRWADVSNRRNGVTWVTLDAPLLQVGGITATLLGSQTNPDVWRAHVEPTQRLYSWAINDHWGTNYRAYQEGPIRFRFILRPHGVEGPAARIRFATGFSQPLLAVAAHGERAASTPLVRISPGDVLVSALKPTDDGRGIIVRLFGASDHTQHASVHWGPSRPKALHLTDASENPGRPAPRSIEVPSRGLVSLRADFE